MFHRIREPFGKAGLIVAVVALVAALAGGAYAATGLNGKQKNEVKSIAKQYAGKKGAAGPAGPAGTAGTQGSKGDAGSNGSNGAAGDDGTDGIDGESVNVIPLSPGDANCSEGGSKFLAGDEEGFACNGLGSAGAGEMSGLFAVVDAASPAFGGVQVTTITFPTVLPTAPTETVLIDFGNTQPELDKCPGSVNAPEATPGILCLYSVFDVTLAQSERLPFGALLAFGPTNETYGSWAVAPAAP